MGQAGHKLEWVRLVTSPGNGSGWTSVAAEDRSGWSQGSQV